MDDATEGTRQQPPTADVAVATHAALRLLRDVSTLRCWVVARVLGAQWVVVAAHDTAYAVRPGFAVPFAATPCRATVETGGARFVPDIAAEPTDARSFLLGALPARAYAGAPLHYEGRLIGTVAGFDPVPRPDVPADLMPLLRTSATLLGALLGADAAVGELRRRAALAEVEAHIDALTQLGNRLAWTRALTEEESRCRRYGRTAGVISVDLDGLKQVNDEAGHAAGDRLLRSAGLVLRRVSRLCDPVARVGGDEFAVLAVETDDAACRLFARRLRTALEAEGIEASIGVAARADAGDLESAWRAADAAMYADKRRRVAERVVRALADPAPAPRAPTYLPGVARSG